MSQVDSSVGGKTGSDRTMCPYLDEMQTHAATPSDLGTLNPGQKVLALHMLLIQLMCFFFHGPDNVCRCPPLSCPKWTPQ
jgi:hypothetical protein